MVPIILTILKIIGIIILVMLAAVILLMLLVLFWPLRYKSDGKYDEDGVFISGRISWFMGLASINFRYENGKPFSARARLLFFTIFDNLQKGGSGRKRRKRRKRRKTLPKEPELKAAVRSKDSSADISADENKYRDTYAYDEDILSKADASGSDERRDDAAEADTGINPAKKKGLFKKFKEFFEKLIKFIDNIKFTFHKIYVIIVKIRDNIKYYWELLQKESTKQAFRLCSRQLSRIFKNISPRKYELKLHIGFEDPAVMGNVLAVWGMLYPFHMGKADIIPEFDRKILEGSFKIKGIISVYIILWAVWLFMTDKNIKRLRRELNI